MLHLSFLFFVSVSLTQASIRDGNGNTALHLACINDDVKMVEALLTPITDNEFKEYSQSTNQLPQSTATKSISIDLEQRNFYGKQPCLVSIISRNYQ